EIHPLTVVTQKAMGAASFGLSESVTGGLRFANFYGSSKKGVPQNQGTRGGTYGAFVQFHTGSRYESGVFFRLGLDHADYRTEGSRYGALGTFFMELITLGFADTDGKKVVTVRGIAPDAFVGYQWVVLKNALIG